MASLTNKTIASTYKDLLQVSNSNSGVDGTLRNIEDGEGTSSALQISQSGVNIDGDFYIGGNQLTATVSALNNIADLTGTNGIVAVSGGNVYGRSIAATGPLSVTNADGTEGNPTIALVSSAVSAGAYGPMSTFTVDGYGIITDVTVASTISANAFIGGTFDGSKLDIENNVSIGGTLIVSGTSNLKEISATDVIFNTVSATSNIYSPVVSTGSLHAVSASIGNLYAANLSFTNVSANALTLSNLTVQTSSSFAGVATFTASTTYDSNVNFKDNKTLSFGDAGDLEIIHNGVHSNIRDVGTGNLFIQSNEIRLTNNGSFSMLTLADGQDADFPYGVQVSGTVSATSFVGPTITSITTAITSINTYITGVSAVFAASINNTNNALTALSATMATSIDNSNTNITANANAITSVNSVITALSATMATSIDNSNTNITANANAITSVNSVITNLSSTMATSIDNTNTNLTALSATMATSIANTNANVTTNINAITSVNSVIANLSSTLATSIGNHLPLAGGTMTGTLTLAGAPSANLEAATKQYVDNLTAAAIHFHDPVRVESPDSAGNLNATYNNGTAGVGATLTNAGTQAALVIDGVTLNTSDRVLIYNQTNGYENGVYTVTDTGSASTNWVLTRATDADSYQPNDNTGIDGGSYFYVQEGDDGAGEAYVCSNVGTITIGTTPITFVQFSSALVYTAGNGINISSGRVISVSGVPSSATIAALSATMATSIDNTNTNLTALSATMATSIANHLPLAGGTLTGHVSGTALTMSGDVSANAYYGDGSNLTGITAGASEGFAIAIAIALG